MRKEKDTIINSKDPIDLNKNYKGVLRDFHTILYYLYECYNSNSDLFVPLG